MINGFEEETKDLNYEEKLLANQIAIWLKGRAGKDMAITSKQMVRVMLEEGYKCTTERRIRKVINYIRTRGMVKNLIASTKGYYVSNDSFEIRRYRSSLIDRATAILAVATAFDIEINENESITNDTIDEFRAKARA
jgi:hypothetical protein